ncbi:NAD-dependent epimerase/dehydratase family protein [Pseudoalteromonas shioyasakiensis]|uniref:NAD-dependent epimerase/dehydratase family protein n=1 Tax=Pseudoalteromonas shioyasakiensis TaxID=1190813 RepID=UPI0022B0F4CB|nr:SDR family oxidoreductase [Pseudoalteromonas shioyasakiensis]MCZ4253667.1 SDR family oxidoreductase [Pseudoalteromonas shioyasakiensis]
MALFTIFGSTGFIGAEVVKQLKNQGHEIITPNRGDTSILSRHLGIVIYCAGYGDCIQNPLNVLEANTTLLAQISEHANFERLVYLSSTRVYMGVETTSENTDLKVLDGDQRRLFNLTKLVSEELLLKSKKDVLIIRPSNVYGLALNSPLFLPAITRSAIQNGHIDMFVNPEYTKDYVSVTDVAYYTLKLALKGNLQNRVFNIASGKNTSAEDISKVLVCETGCEVKWHPNECDDKFFEIDISNIQSELTYNPRGVLEDLVDMVRDFKKSLQC